jgi:hypothetical protein
MRDVKRAVALDVEGVWAGQSRANFGTFSTIG